jgi:hypothetical protein
VISWRAKEENMIKLKKVENRIRSKAIAKRALTCFLMFLFFQYGFSQNTRSINCHSFTIGISSLSVTDNYLDLSLKGIQSTELAYSYSAISPYRKKSILIAWNNGQAGNAKLNDFRAVYADAFSVIKNKNSRFNTYLGYTISTNPVFITKGNEVKQYSWAASTSLSAYSSSVYSWRKNNISLDLSIPVVGFASRPENNKSYGGNMNELLYESYDNLFFTSFHNQKSVLLSVQYSREISKRIHLQAGYQYSYKKLIENDLFRQVSDGLQAGFSYRLK